MEQEDSKKKEILRLGELLDDGNDAIRERAAESLAKFGEESFSVLPALIEALNDEDEIVCKNAAYAIGSIGPKASEAMSSLVYKIQRTKLKETAIQCIWALGKMEKGAESILDFLVQLLKHQDAEIRSEAVKSLGAIGADFPPIIVALINLLIDASADVRYQAQVALFRTSLRSAKARQMLMQNIENKRDTTRWKIISILGEVGPEAKEAVEVLKPLYHNAENKVFAEHVKKTLLRIGPIGPRTKLKLPESPPS